MTEGLGLREATERFVARAKRLVDESGVQVPPLDPAHLAKLQGVNRIVLSSSLDTSGRLIRNGNEVVIVLSSKESRERRNFTCCHEIAHTFQLDGTLEGFRLSAPGGTCMQRSAEEYLCDRAAAEMLMPGKFFKPAAEALEPSIAAVQELSKSFDASIGATIIRLGSLSCWKVVFVVWKLATTLEGSSPKLRVSWSVRPARFRCFIPKHASADRSSGIYAAFLTGRPTFQQEKLDLGSLQGRHFVGSARFGDHVLSIVHEPNLRMEEKHAG